MASFIINLVEVPKGPKDAVVVKPVFGPGGKPKLLSFRKAGLPVPRSRVLLVWAFVVGIGFIYPDNLILEIVFRRSLASVDGPL